MYIVIEIKFVEIFFGNRKQFVIIFFKLVISDIFVYLLNKVLIKIDIVGYY